MWYRLRISKPLSNRSKFEIFWSGCTNKPTVNVNFLGHLEELNVFEHTVLVTQWPSFWKPRSICAIDQKNFTFVKNRPKNDICYLNFEIFEKVEFLHDHKELVIGHGTVMFSERSPIRRRNNFKIWPNLKLSIFNISWFDLNCCMSVTLRIWEMVRGTFLLAKWNRSRISKPFSNRSKFEIFRSAHAPTIFKRSFFSVTLWTQKCLSIQFSENRVTFELSLKKYFIIFLKSVKNWHLPSLNFKNFTLKFVVKIYKSVMGLFL